MQGKYNNIEFKSALKDLEVVRYLTKEDYLFGMSKLEYVIRSCVRKVKTLVFALFLSLLIITFLFAEQANAASRIKDIVYFEGIRDNILVGYGLVVGLNGSGDNLKNAPFTEKGLEEFLSRMGISTKGTNLKTKNIAAVTVTATLPPFARNGNKFDVSVSTMGDAKSLEGGTLLATPLMGADGNVYAVAQGPVALGGVITTSSTSNAADKSVPTSGVVPDGATVEKEINFNLSKMNEIRLSLRNPDISTARRVSESINDVVGEDAASAIDPGTIDLHIPEIYGDNIIGLLADIEQVIVEPDQMARIVIDESSGTVVIGEDVKIDTIAIAQGNLMVSINNTQDEEQSKFSGDVKKTSASIQTSTNKAPGNGFAIVRQGANLRDLVTGLNALGVGTRDLITILQTIKVAGALHANIEVR